MKIIFTSLFVLSFLLSACAPSVIPPTATLTPFPTATLTPTLIPTLTPTATPIAMDGVAEVDGLLYVYDEQTQNWVALPPLPEGTIKAKVDSGVVGAYGVDGNLLYTLNGMEWEKAGIRYEYLSYNAQFEAALKEKVENGAFPEDLSTVKRMYYEDGTEVPYGYLTSLTEGGRKYHIISGVLGEGWVDVGPPFKLDSGIYGAPLLMVPREDGSRVVLTLSSMAVDLPHTVAFLPGAVSNEPWKTPDLEFFRTTADKTYDFMRLQTGEEGRLVGRQVIVVLDTKSSQTVGFEQYNIDLQELVDYLMGKSDGDLVWSGLDGYPPIVSIWYLPEVGVRP